MRHGVTFNFGCVKVCSLAIFETSFCHDKDISIAATDCYMHLYIIVLFPLTAIRKLINFTGFTPQPLRAVGVLFSPMVSGWAGGGK